MRIRGRDQWGARPPKRAVPRMQLPAPEVWLHHGASPNGYTRARVPSIIRSYQDHHMRPGWAGTKDGAATIGYSFLVDNYGEVWEGRGAGAVGAHTKGRNSRSHAICLVGNYDTLVPPEEVLNAVAWLLIHGQRAGWWPKAQLTGGHRDVGSTSCPGRHAYARIGAINSLAASPDLEEEDDMDMIIGSKDHPHLYLKTGRHKVWISPTTFHALADPKGPTKLPVVEVGMDLIDALEPQGRQPKK